MDLIFRKNTDTDDFFAKKGKNTDTDGFFENEKEKKSSVQMITPPLTEALVAPVNSGCASCSRCNCAISQLRRLRQVAPGCERLSCARCVYVQLPWRIVTDLFTL